MPHNTTTSTFQAYALTQQSPIKSETSDHNILIHGTSLSWNIMMQGRWNDSKHRYNNGFGKQETQTQYQLRLSTVVRVLAEIIHLNPHIHTIALQEAPITPEDIQHFSLQAQTYPSLQHFASQMHPNQFSSMGIATFFNSNLIQATHIDIDTLPQLKDRIHYFHCQPAGQHQTASWHSMNVHMPYDIAKSSRADKLIAIIQQWFNTQIATIILGDFNIHPDIVYHALQGISAFAKAQNNLLCKADSAGKITSQSFDTVDAMLYHPRLDCHADMVYRNGTDHPMLRANLIYQAGLFAPKQHDKQKHQTDTLAIRSPGVRHLFALQEAHDIPAQGARGFGLNG